MIHMTIGLLKQVMARYSSTQTLSLKAWGPGTACSTYPLEDDAAAERTEWLLAEATLLLRDGITEALVEKALKQCWSYTFNRLAENLLCSINFVKQ